MAFDAERRADIALEEQGARCNHNAMYVANAMLAAERILADMQIISAAASCCESPVYVDALLDSMGDTLMALVEELEG